MGDWFPQAPYGQLNQSYPIQDPHGFHFPSRAKEPQMDIPNELRDTLTDEELDMPISKIIDDQAKKPKARKRTAAQAALDGPPAKIPTFTRYKGGSAGRKAFSVAELDLLNDCVEEVGLEGGDIWIKVAEKYDRDRRVRLPPSEWPERTVSSLRKRFNDMTNSKPRTGEAVIPAHIKRAKDIFRSRLGCIEEWHSGGSDNDNGLDDIDMPTKKAPSDLEPSVRQPQPPSSSRRSGKSKGGGSSRAEQKELVHNFFSGRAREERDHTRFQQQAQLTSLAHEYESNRAKDQQIMELRDKLDKKRDELHQAQLENMSLQQALRLRELSSNDPSLFENLAHASNYIGLRLPSREIHRNSEASESSGKHIKLERCTPPFPSPDTSFPSPSLRIKREHHSPSLPTHSTHERLPRTSTAHEVIEILDSDEEQPPFPSCDTVPLGLSSPTKSPTVPDHYFAPFPHSPSPLPTIQQLVSSIPPVAGPSKFQSEHFMWAPLPRKPSATVQQAVHLPGVNQLSQGLPGL